MQESCSPNVTPSSQGFVVVVNESLSLGLRVKCFVSVFRGPEVHPEQHATSDPTGTRPCSHLWCWVWALGYFGDGRGTAPPAAHAGAEDEAAGRGCGSWHCTNQHNRWSIRTRFWSRLKLNLNFNLTLDYGLDSDCKLDSECGFFSLRFNLDLKLHSDSDLWGGWVDCTLTSNLTWIWDSPQTATLSRTLVWAQTLD